MSGQTKQQKKRSSKVAKKKRSKAQIEASRKNGAKSKGPTSKAGKRNSRANAFKHGLTAKLLTPIRDNRRHDELYKQIHQELINEYEPEGFISEWTVQNLANDYIQMIRCRQMIEVLQRPMGLTDEDQRDWDKMDLAKRDCESLAAASACITAKQDLVFPLEVARRIASMVTGLVEGVEQDVREIEGGAPSVDPITGKELDPFDEDEAKETLELWGIIKPLSRKLADEDHLTRLFNGHAAARRMELNRLQKLLNHLEQRARWRVSSQRKVEELGDMLIDKRIFELANDPKRIVLLERYLRDIERSIDRKTKKLEERQASASLPDSDDS